MPSLTRRGAWQAAVLLVLTALAVLLVSKTTGMASSDLGRHLVNGRLTVEEGVIPSTNLYSYTYPDFPFLNHHWATGVVLYLVERVAGFPGLGLLRAVITASAFLIAIGLAWRASRLETAALSALLMLPLIGSRTEIRPEMFTTLFAMLTLAALSLDRRVEKTATLVGIPLLTAAWVNLHSYFILAPIVVGAFLFDALAAWMREKKEEDKRAVRRLLLLLLLTCTATFLNPWGIRGAAAPFLVVQDYGYSIMENQRAWTVFWLLPFTQYFAVGFAAWAAGWIVAWRCGALRADRPWLAWFLVSGLLGAMAWLGVRNIGLFGFLAIPALAACLDVPAVRRWWDEAGVTIATLMLAASGLLLFAPHLHYWTGQIPIAGLGARPWTFQAMTFLRNQDLRGPIFNNYDIGGYLIYALYPEERVFVDNRPEAYPSSFFTDVLQPLQQSEEAWERGMNAYGFNTIVYNVRERSGWTVDFLNRRLKDPDWALVFRDPDKLIFARRIPEHAEMIEAFELRGVRANGG